MVRFLFVSLFCVLVSPLFAQISHGGSPLFLLSNEGDGLRSALDDSSLFVEMPAFNVDSLKADDELNESNMRGAFRFANKFFHTLEIGKSGHNLTLADGTKVWQVGIRSKGAYSINLYFSEFYIPEGGQLFLYSADQSHVLGSFTHENNSGDGLFPTSPVYGDEIIVEYSQPASVTSDARLKISEINHDYRGILRVEPENSNSANYNCMPDILCSEAKDWDENRSAVLLIVNGTGLCSGAMINNTSNDGTPYLLTAMHCFNSSNPIVHKPEQEYINSAGTIVAFFHYNRPVCNTKMRGMEEMSVAGAYARCIIEPLDIALLELKESPPDYYQAFYAGWNIDPQVHTKTAYVSNIHHPHGDLAKYGKTTKKLTYGSFEGNIFERNSFWEIPGWTIGSTHGGSSGSPLFDDNNLIIGSLTGGGSLCSGNRPNGVHDSFSRLHLGWKYKTDVDSLRLDTWLDKTNTGLTSLSGIEASDVSLSRSSNTYYNDGDQLEVTTVEDDTDYLFGANLRNTKEFAEMFEVEDSCRLYGAFLLTPAVAYPTDISIHVYDSDNGKPGEILASAVFRPRYMNYSGGAYSERNKSMSQASESFVRWDTEPRVGKQFFIGYELPESNAPFRVYNALFYNNRKGTAWIKDPLNGWTEIRRYTPLSMNTALAIQVLTDGVVYSDTATIKLPQNRLYYNYKERALHFIADPAETGWIRLYDISGRLLREFSFEGDVSHSLIGLNNNTVGIVHLKSDRRNQRLKIIL